MLSTSRYCKYHTACLAIVGRRLGMPGEWSNRRNSTWVMFDSSKLRIYIKVCLQNKSTGVSHLDTFEGMSQQIPYCARADRRSWNTARASSPGSRSTVPGTRQKKCTNTPGRDDPVPLPAWTVEQQVRTGTKSEEYECHRATAGRSPQNSVRRVCTITMFNVKSQLDTF